MKSNKYQSTAESDPVKASWNAKAIGNNGNWIKPKLDSVPLATGLAWTGNGWLFQEKSDGFHEFAQIGGIVANAERMADGSLVVNDLVSVGGFDDSRLATWARWGELVAMQGELPVGVRLSRVGQGGEFLRQLLSEGGEGAVAKPLYAPFGSGWLKCKRSQVFICRVGALDHHKGSVELFDAVTGQARGKLALRGRFDAVQVGSVLKVEAFGLTERGMLREARLDRDSENSWLISF